MVLSRGEMLYSDNVEQDAFEVAKAQNEAIVFAVRKESGVEIFNISLSKYFDGAYVPEDSFSGRDISCDGLSEILGSIKK